jgi:predicted nucleic acid-binding protein
LKRVLLDSSVVLDIFTNDPVRSDDSSQALLRMVSAGFEACIDDLVYAEISAGFSKIETLDAALGGLGLVHDPIPKEALFLAGKAFLAYRRGGGPKTSVLPDFLIGAHAAVRGYPLLTRDPGRVEKAYPRLRVLSPKNLEL